MAITRAQVIRRARLLKQGGMQAVSQDELLQRLQFVKGDQGDTPRKGIDYFTPAELRGVVDAVYALITIPEPIPGKTPLPGIDYPTKLQVEAIVLAAVSKIVIPQPVDGKTPQKGVDYFTLAEIDNLATLASRLVPKVDESAMEARITETVMDTLYKRLVKDIKEAIPVRERALPQISLMGRAGSKTLEVWSGTSPIGQDIRKLIFEGSALSVARVGDGVAVVTGTGGAASGANVSTEKLTPTTSGDNITLDLTGLAHTFATVQWVAKNGQILDPADATFGWSRSTNTITVLNAANTDVFLVAYTYA